MCETQHILIYDDLWRHILRFLPPSSIHNCNKVNKLFASICHEPKLYSNLVCRIKCFSPVPLSIDDNTSTISISVYDEYNTYFKSHLQLNDENETKNEDHQINRKYKSFNVWLKRLSKCKYLDMGSFPLDEEYLHNQLLSSSIESIIHCNEEFLALHFDGFYSDEVKSWFLENIIPKLTTELRHLSLRWDQWNLSGLQIMDNFKNIFNHFWVSLDGRSHSFQFPLDYVTKSYLRDNNYIQFEYLQVLSLYRLYFPRHSLQSLLNASCNLKILYMFASSWKEENDDNDEEQYSLFLPKGLRSISILLCDGIVYLDKCGNDLVDIMLDSPTNQIAKYILKQLINGTMYSNLRKLSVCFWSGISDNCQDTDSEKEIELIVKLICAIHENGKTNHFDNLSLNLHDQTIKEDLRNALMMELSELYGRKYEMTLSKIENIAKNCEFVLDNADDKRFIKRIVARKFGLLRNT